MAELWEGALSDDDLPLLLRRVVGNDVTERLGRLLSARAVGLFIHCFAPTQGATGGTIVSQSGIDPVSVSGYGQVAGRNPWFMAIRGAAPGQVATGTELVPAWELVRTPFYRDWLRPLNLRHALIGVAHRDSEAQTLVLVVGLRAPNQAPFGSTERQIVEAYLPMLSANATIGLKAERLAIATEALVKILDACSDAVLLVDEKLRPVIVNSAARLLLAQRDGIAIYGSVITVSHPETITLRRVVAGESAAGAQGSSLLLIHRTGKAPLLLSVQHFQRPLQIRENAPCAVAAIIVRPPEDDEIGGLFRGHYGMTATEARLARLIATGSSLLAAAAEMSISHNTARTHMKRIYAKTDTHRQVDLVRLLGVPSHVTEPGVSASPAERDSGSLWLGTRAASKGRDSGSHAEKSQNSRPFVHRRDYDRATWFEDQQRRSAFFCLKRPGRTSRFL
jgi:DNA-binding CsgD family transcriptional regulator